MSNIQLKVEFLAGTNIDNAIQEASMLAFSLGVAYVKFDFNGTPISVPPFADVDQGVLDYQREVRKLKGFVVVDSRK